MHNLSQNNFVVKTMDGALRFCFVVLYFGFTIHMTISIYGGDVTVGNKFINWKFCDVFHKFILGFNMYFVLAIKGRLKIGLCNR